MSTPTDAGVVAARARRGLAWVGTATAAAAVLDAVTSIFVLRLWVTPAAFGVAMLAVTLFRVIDLAVDAGVLFAVIQRDGDGEGYETRLSTAFWTNTAISVVLALLLATVGGPLLALFHRTPVVGAMLAVYGLKLLWGNIYAVPAALLKRELRYRAIGIIRVAANLAEAFGRVALAALLPPEHAAWCFVLAPFVRVLVSAVGTLLARPWRPRFVFDRKMAAEDLGFGARTAGSHMLLHLLSTIDLQIVGRLFGAAPAGLYAIASHIVIDPLQAVGSVISDVAFPTFARLRTRVAELREQVVMFARATLVLVTPPLALVAVAADDVIALIFGPRWAAATACARALTASGIFRALGYSIPPLLDGIGVPGRSVVYAASAAAFLPAWQALVGTLASPALGDGAVTIALSWTIAAPLLLALLLWLAGEPIGLRERAYARGVLGILRCAALALAAAALARLAAAATPAPIRLPIVAAALLTAFALTLRRFEGITIRGLLHALREERGG